MAEIFSTLTGNPNKRLTADDAAATIDNLCAHLDFVDLTASEMRAALKVSQKRGVRGGRVHDFMHAVAAGKSGAATLLTLDRNDFAGLVDSLTIEEA